MGRKTNFECRCEKCGKPQPRNDKLSNGNWNAFDCNQKCECGGKFVMYVNGQKMG